MSAGFVSLVLGFRDSWLVAFRIGAPFGTRLPFAVGSAVDGLFSCPASTLFGEAAPPIMFIAPVESKENIPGYFNINTKRRALYLSFRNFLLYN